VDPSKEKTMAITRLLAQMTVRDLDQAVEWYGRFFGRKLDANPMDGLVEWHLTKTFGVQVWSEPDRAGHSAMVLDESDLDTRVTELASAGITYDGPQDATTSRIVKLTDPDGNRIVLTAPLPD
jgi:predicted enzyme related to lactoylglutathione lyase